MALPTLRRRAGFHRVYSRGQAQRSNGVVVHYLSNDLGTTRYGIAAKATTGSAVVRNRIRRWTRELLRRWHPMVAEGYDIVVLAQTREAAESYGSYARHLRQAIEKAELFDNVPELHN